MSSNQDGTPDRYRVERGTDGSFLIVDYGTDRNQRLAIGRETNVDDALQEARSLSGLDSVTSTFETPSTGFWADVSHLVADATEPLDTEHSFNHLLAPERTPMD